MILSSTKKNIEKSTNFQIDFRISDAPLIEVPEADSAEARTLRDVTAAP